MKKFKTLIICLLISLSSLLLFACDKGVPVESISFTKQEVEIFISNSSYLNLTCTPSKCNYFDVVWSSSDSTIVSVNQRGRITAENYGTAIITASVVDSDIKAECKVVVNDGEVFKLEIDDSFIKKDYYAGETFDPEGLIVKAYYESGIVSTLSPGEYTITCPEILTENTQAIITFKNASTSIDLNVISDIATSIAIIKPPTKTQYYIGEKFDKTGMEVALVYGSGKTEKIQDFSFEDNILSYQTNSVKIKYQGFETTQEISVKPHKTIYDITKLQEAIDEAQDGESIMIKEGIYNINKSFTIPSSKKIYIFGETENVEINAYNCSVFVIQEQEQGNIKISQIKLSLAQGEGIELIVVPDGIEIDISDLTY